LETDDSESIHVRVCEGTKDTKVFEAIVKHAKPVSGMVAQLGDYVLQQYTNRFRIISLDEGQSLDEPLLEMVMANFDFAVFRRTTADDMNTSMEFNHDIIQLFNLSSEVPYSCQGIVCYPRPLLNPVSDVLLPETYRRSDKAKKHQSFERTTSLGKFFDKPLAGINFLALPIPSNCHIKMLWPRE